jgi:hypothetical protein
MKRTILLGVAVLAGLLGAASISEAQVFVRAPFVRVWVGDGVSVRAPFVNVNVPPSGPYYYYPRVVYAPPVVVETPPPNQFVPPLPKPAVDPNAPPQPVQPVQGTTIESFAKTFQAKAGAYEVTLLNPVNNQPTAVRFTLPEGTPRRVITNRDSIEFFYRIGHWVRIEFDKDGVTVSSR